MQLQIDKLGKVSITVEEGYWDINKDYDKLTVVEKEGTFGTFISRKPVPAGTVLTDREYWIPFSSLKEEIIIDYNQFINKYQPIIDDIVNRLDQESRLSKNIIPITYKELAMLRSRKCLIPGLWYRITDYKTTTTQTDTSVGDVQFDILVLATSEDTLSEEAKAVRHEGDSHLPADTQFNAWKIWYCLDNDTSRFFWADEENGKGVIYRMIDEFGNDCPYDFKSILFKNVYNGIYQYTFNSLPDESIDESMYGPKNNKITPFITTIEVDYKSKTVQLLNNIILYVNSEFTLQNVLPTIWTDAYANNRIENNTFINCYNSIIIKPENNFIINSSLKLISVCVDNNIHDCIFDIKHGENILEWNDGLCLFRNDIKKSTIHKNAFNAHKETPNAITFSNIFTFTDNNDRLGHMYIDHSNINLFRVESDEESEGNIDIQASYIFDTSIFTQAEGRITINESTISNSCIDSVLRQDYGDYIDVIIDKSKITNVTDSVLYALYSSSIQNSNSIVCAEKIYDSNIQNSEGLICLDYIYDSNICNVTNTTLNVSFEHADIKSIDDYGDISDVNLDFSTVYEDRTHQLLIDKR